MGIEIKGEVSQPTLNFISDYITLNFLYLDLMDTGKYIYAGVCKFIKKGRYKLIVEVE